VSDAHPAIAALRDLLIVEELDTDLYRSAALPEMSGRVFGGQVIAQALASAIGSVSEDKAVHSLHAYFLRAGDYARPIIYRVIRDFDGGTFANRRVVAMQDGKPILNLAASFQRFEEGFSHTRPIPDIPGPEQSIPITRLMEEGRSNRPKAFAAMLAAVEARVGMRDPKGEGPLGMPIQHSWFRLHPDLGAERARVALAFCSDFGLVSTGLLPHGIEWFSGEILGASLDHAIWFHEDPPLGEWLLYAMDSPWAGHARGFNRGSIYDQSGRMIASIAQEGLMRHRPQG
jgi:acyl-CoA thioesterase II